MTGANQTLLYDAFVMDGIDEKLYHEQNCNVESVNVSNLSNGIYMMKVTLDNGNTYTEKIVKE